MKNFFKRLERIFSYLFILGLILLSTIQIILTNPVGYERINWLNQKFNNLFAEQKPKAVSTIGTYTEEMSGYFILDLMNNYPGNQIWILKNGMRINNFNKGLVRVYVKDGDFISLDAQSVNEPVWFKITEVSPTISGLEQGQLFRLENEKIFLAEITMEEEVY